jgi:DNA-binding NarL/FixJ family response regulator
VRWRAVAVTAFPGKALPPLWVPCLEVVRQVPEEALGKALSEVDAEVVVLDCRTPRPGSAFVVRELLARFPQKSLVAVTRLGQDGDVVAAMVGSCQEFLTGTAEDLGMAICHVLAMRRRHGGDSVPHVVVRMPAGEDAGRTLAQWVGAWRLLPGTGAVLSTAL